jgi:hypothetical protein
MTDTTIRACGSTFNIGDRFTAGVDPQADIDPDTGDLIVPGVSLAVFEEDDDQFPVGWWNFTHEDARRLGQQLIAAADTAATMPLSTPDPCTICITDKALGS